MHILVVTLVCRKYWPELNLVVGPNNIIIIAKILAFLNLAVWYGLAIHIILSSNKKFWQILIWQLRRKTAVLVLISLASDHNILLAASYKLAQPWIKALLSMDKLSTSTFECLPRLNVHRQLIFNTPRVLHYSVSFMQVLNFQAYWAVYCSILGKRPCTLTPI